MPTGLPDWYLGILLHSNQIPLKTDFYQQTVPMIARREWQSEIEEYRYFLYRGSISAGSTVTVISYTTGSDEELYLTDSCFTGLGEGVMRILVGATYKYIVRTPDGRAVPYGFTLPIKVPASTTVEVEVYNPTSSSVYYMVSLWGYTVTV